MQLTWTDLLRDDGIVVDQGQQALLSRYCALIRESNEALSLVSARDVDRLEEIHIPDSASLAPWVRRNAEPNGRLLDIGSGAGFPGLVIAIVLKSLHVILLERSEKKAKFLMGVVEELGMEQVEVVWGEFPYAAQEMAPDVITARAVEKPEKARAQILTYLQKGSVFLCQTPDKLGLIPKSFHVERVEDAWTAAGLRRGPLQVVRRR